ncbi:MAG: sensor histidine kinase, partial [Bacteroidota bacterium]
ERANSFSNLGIYFYQKGQMDSTARYFIQARRMWEAAGESYYGAVVGMNLSVIFIQLKDFPKAYQYLHLAIPVFDSLGNQSSLAMAYNNLASVVKESGAVDSIRKSTRIHLKALRIREAIGDSAGIATSLNNIGGNYADLKESAQAIPYLKQALAIKRSLGISQGEAQALYNLGLAYQEEGSLSKSRNYFGQSLSRARKLGSPEDMRLAYLGLAESAAAQGRYEEAYTYRLSYETIQDSLVSAEKAAEIQRLNVEYETEKNERLLQEEKQKAEIATLSVSRQRTQIGFLVSALLLGGGLAFLLFQQNRLQHRYRLNEQLIQQQKERLDAVLETQELERERIARDLHDGIGQLLTATRMQVNALGDPVILQKDTAHILPMLDEAIGEVRAISHTMMPLSLEEYGLGVALEEMLNKSLGKGELVYTFEVLGKEVRMEKKAELAVYRIAQELIGNVLKHAGASQVMVQLLFRSGTLSLRVEDNGQGIQEEGSGMGLRNIHDRLKALQGSFSTETNAQEGTTAVINIPL